MTRYRNWWHFQFSPHDTHDWDSNHVGARRPRSAASASRWSWSERLLRPRHRSVAVRQTLHGLDGRSSGRRPSDRPQRRQGMHSGHGAAQLHAAVFRSVLHLFFVTARGACATYVPKKQVIVPDEIGQRRRAPRPGQTRRAGTIDAITGERKWSSASPPTLPASCPPPGRRVRRRQRRQFHGLRCAQRQEPLALPDRVPDLGWQSDDLHARSEAVRHHPFGIGGDGVRAAVSEPH